MLDQTNHHIPGICGLLFDKQMKKNRSKTKITRVSFDSATIQKIYSHWSTGARKGRMSGQIPTTLDPSLTQRMLMNSYSSANHDDIHTIAARNGNFSFRMIFFCLFSKSQKHI